ncbi:MAG: hypothetical protein IJ312_05965 [Treponema sp.]|nr:hypothetical protein [Treponema sp.]
MAFDNGFDSIDELQDKNQDLDRYGVWVKKPPRTIHDEQTSSECMDDSSESVEITEDINIDCFSDSNENNIVQNEIEIPEEPSITEDISYELPTVDMEVPTDFPSEETEIEDISVEVSSEVTEETVPDVISNFTSNDDIPDFNPEAFGDGEISLDSFFSSTPNSSETTDAASFEDGEISLDSFFDDIGSEGISIDDFMPSEGKNKNDIIDDPPIDIELSFDDSFSLVPKNDKSDQSDGFSDGFDLDNIFDNIVDETEGESSPIPDFTSSTESSNIPDIEAFMSTNEMTSFDSIDSIENIEDNSVEQETKQEETTESSIAFDEVTEFDDLLGDIENQTASSADVAPDSEAKQNKIIDYDITVSADDDDIQEIQSIQTETDDDDNEDDISLYMDNPENISEDSNQNVNVVSYDDDFDLDKIMSEVVDMDGNDDSINEESTKTSEPEETVSLVIDDEQELSTISETAEINNIPDSETTEINNIPEIADDIFDDDFFETTEKNNSDVIEDIAQNDSDNIYQEELLTDNELLLEPLDEILDKNENIVSDDFATEKFIADETENIIENEQIIDESVLKESTTEVDSLLDISDIEPEYIEEETLTELEQTPEMPEEDVLPSFDNNILSSDKNDSISSDEQITEETSVSAFDDDTFFEEPVMMDDSVTEETTEEQIVQDEQQTEPVQEVAETSESNKILQNIASELAVLREEISNLKSDFAQLKNGSIPKQEETEEKETTGFFDESEDDETIALSDNELTNILNTADFTEESEELCENENCENENIEETEEVLDDSSSEMDIYNDDEYTTEETGLPQIDFEAEQLEEPSDLTENELETSSEDFIEPDATMITNEVDNSEENLSTDSNTEDMYTEDEALDFEEESLEESLPEEIDVSTEECEEITDEPVEAVFESEQWGVVEPAVADDMVEIDEEPVVADDMVEIDEEPAVADDMVEIDEEPAVADDMVEIDEEPAVADDMVEIDEEPAVADDMVKIDEEPAVADDMVEIDEEPAVADDMVEIDEELAVADDMVEIDEEPVVANDMVEIDEEPVVADITENETDDVTVFNSNDETANTEEDNKTENSSEIPSELKQDIKSVLSYMDQLLDNLPEEKIAEFAKSEHFELYKKLFSELGLS